MVGFYKPKFFFFFFLVTRWFVQRFVTIALVCVWTEALFNTNVLKERERQRREKHWNRGNSAKIMPNAPKQCQKRNLCDIFNIQTCYWLKKKVELFGVWIHVGFTKWCSAKRIRKSVWWQHTQEHKKQTLVLATKDYPKQAYQERY